MSDVNAENWFNRSICLCQRDTQTAQNIFQSCQPHKIKPDHRSLQDYDDAKLEADCLCMCEQ